MFLPAYDEHFDFATPEYYKAGKGFSLVETSGGTNMTKRGGGGGELKSLVVKGMEKQINGNNYII
jgi:hypothetical protein